MNTIFALRSIPKQWGSNVFGMEFECNMPTRAERDRLINEGYHHFFYATLDGSLSFDRGIEFVSQPLSYQMLTKALQKMTKRFPDVGPSVYGAIHIHIPKTPTNLKKAQQIQEILLGLSPHEIMDFAGRMPNNYCPVLNDGRNPRYQWINIANKDTIEFRGFSNFNNFGWKWAQVALSRLQYLLDKPTVQQFKKAHIKYPFPK